MARYTPGYNKNKKWVQDVKLEIKLLTDRDSLPCLINSTSSLVQLDGSPTSEHITATQSSLQLLQYNRISHGCADLPL